MKVARIFKLCWSRWVKDKKQQHARVRKLEISEHGDTTQRRNRATDFELTLGYTTHGVQRTQKVYFPCHTAPVSPTSNIPPQGQPWSVNAWVHWSGVKTWTIFVVYVYGLGAGWCQGTTKVSRSIDILETAWRTIFMETVLTTYSCAAACASRASNHANISASNSMFLGVLLGNNDWPENKFFLNATLVYPVLSMRIPRFLTSLDF